MNVQLDELCTWVGWSRKELARRVNQRGRRRGLHLHTDATRVRHWLSGQRPQPPVPELLSELFSEELGTRSHRSTSARKEPTSPKSAQDTASRSPLPW